MNTVLSKDGTPIAYDKVGSGPAVVLVDGALCYRGAGPSGPLAALLSPKFTVYTYDRRGRGDSGDTPPYAPQREVEDLEAVVKEAGGGVFLYGISSGAVLSLEAANSGLSVKKLAVYEAPLIIDDTRAPLPLGYLKRLKDHVAAGRRGKAVAMFLRTVGLPSFLIPIMALMPFWKNLKAVAHTLPYDIEIVQGNQRGEPLPKGQWNRVKAPTWTGAGGKSPVYMVNGMKALTAILPSPGLVILEGQTHDLKPEALVGELEEFFQ